MVASGRGTNIEQDEQVAAADSTMFRQANPVQESGIIGTQPEPLDDTKSVIGRPLLEII